MLALHCIVFFKIVFFSFIIQTSAATVGRHIFKNSHISRQAHNDDHEADRDYDHITFEEKKTDNEKSNNNLGVHIRNVEGIYVCGNDKVCAMVDEYIISKDLSFDCHERNLPIYFQASKHVSNKTEKAKGFLTKDKALITTSQKLSNECLQVKR